MEYSSLVEFFDGRKSAIELRKEIESEVALAESAPLSMAFEDWYKVPAGPDIHVEAKHLAVLLRSLLDKSLPFEFANYVARCIALSQNFTARDEQVKMAIEFVWDDSYPPTDDQIRAWLDRLS